MPGKRPWHGQANIPETPRRLDGVARVGGAASMLVGLPLQSQIWQAVPSAELIPVASRQRPDRCLTKLPDRQGPLLCRGALQVNVWTAVPWR